MPDFISFITHSIDNLKIRRVKIMYIPQLICNAKIKRIPIWCIRRLKRIYSYIDACSGYTYFLSTLSICSELHSLYNIVPIYFIRKTKKNNNMSLYMIHVQDVLYQMHISSFSTQSHGTHRVAHISETIYVVCTFCVKLIDVDVFTTRKLYTFCVRVILFSHNRKHGIRRKI